jgi:hypothetical protein
MKRFFNGREVKRTKRLEGDRICIVFVSPQRGDRGEQQIVTVAQYEQGIKPSVVKAVS